MNKLRVLVLFAPLLVACGSEGENLSHRPVVLVSVPPQAFFVEKMAGNLVEIKVLLPPGASPATFEPGMKQLRAAARASIYVKVGHPRFPFEEAWLEKFVAQNPDLQVVDGSHGASYQSDDPHLWISPRYARVMAGNIAQSLKELFPEKIAEIDQNHGALLAEIHRLDKDLRQELAGVRGKRFYTFHPAWGYLAADYGLRQIAVQREGKEPSPAQLAQTIGEARSAGVSTLFVQPHFSQRAAQIVASEIGANLVTLDPLARNWPENLRKVARAMRQAAR